MTFSEWLDFAFSAQQWPRTIGGLSVYLALLASVIWLNVSGRAMDRDGQWHTHIHGFWGQSVMRRLLPDGTWEMRPLTDAEEYQKQHDEAW